MRKKIIIIAGLFIILTGCGSTNLVAQAPTSSKSTKVESTESSQKSAINLYMEKNNISLAAKDIQFNMPNNLDKEFAISGTAKLDNYYNYGFNNDKDYFCIKVSTDGTLENSWYLYCHRNSFSKLFDDLKQSDCSILAKCIIESTVYKSGQGNMAKVLSINWDKTK